MNTASGTEVRDDIAVIGMAGRFPKARNVDEFWANLRSGIDCVTEYTDEELTELGFSVQTLTNPNYVKARPTLDDADMFDAAFFGMSPTEADVTDPQQRIFLECASEALDNAGYDPTRFGGNIGVFGGASMNNYWAVNLRSNRDLLDRVGGLPVEIGNDKDYLTTRVSYKLNLHGPSVNVQSACSTSLVAVHLACESLLNGESDLALAGGVSVRVPPRGGYTYEEGSILSPDGRCRPFDSQAQGTVFGDGVGIVVLKRLDEAMAAGDSIYAVIKGSAVNNDGSLKMGFTAPSIDGQAAVIAEAQAVAGVEPHTIGYVEAHGTATNLGDPIEVAALERVFAADAPEPGYCALGAVKSNIGHLNTAAGVAGLIKTIQALRHRQIPPTLHFKQANPKIDFARSPFHVAEHLEPWHRNGTPRRAGVSAFGIGGTNAHIVVEEAPRLEPSGPSRPFHLLPLSAKNPAALDDATARLAQHLRAHPETSLADAAYTLQVGRRAFSQRRFVLASDFEDALHALESEDPKRLIGATRDAAQPVVAFLFPGQGAQHARMAAEVYANEPVFRAALDHCAELLLPHLGLDLREVCDERSERLNQTALTQPALFAVEYALAQLWQSWGVEPQAMLGHSIGEYVAACLSGVFSLEDGLALVAARGRLMQQLPPGRMLAVPLDESEVRPRLHPGLSIATINGPGQCVVSGPIDAIDCFQSQLAADDIDARVLHTSHAFHSAMMDPILDEFAALVGAVDLAEPRIPYISNVSGTWITATEATDPHYWATHLRSAVRFGDGLALLLQEPERLLLEVGPSRTLATFGRQHPSRSEQHIIINSLPHPKDVESDHAVLLTALGRAWLAGVDVDWNAFSAHERRSRLALPGYPFQRQRYWVQAQKQTAALNARQAANQRNPDLSDWFYAPSWRRAPLPTASTAAEPQRWLVFADDSGLGAGLLKQLQSRGEDAVAVMPGGQFTAFSDTVYAVDPTSREDYAALLAEHLPTRIVHLWNASNAPVEHERAQDLGFRGLLALTQAIGDLEKPEPIAITVVSSGVHEVTGGETLAPSRATLLGPCAVIPREYPHLSVQAIDLDTTELASPATAARLLRELDSTRTDAIVAYRAGHRWVQSFEPVRLDQSEPLPIRDGGTYLLTGGLGGIALELAHDFASRASVNLVLVSRSGLPPRGQWATWSGDAATAARIHRVQALEELGATVLPLSADVTDREQMAHVVDVVRTRFGQIDGVLHAAGVPGGGMLQLKTFAAAAEVLAPKVQGALVLDDVLGDAPIDFVVFCSSLLSLTGGVGQVDYCAANAFLDAFAHDLSARRNTRAVSINWPGWAEVGMLARAQSSAQPVDNANVISPATHWILDEHRIAGQPVVPGTAYLEMLRAAAENADPTGAIELRDVMFLSPLSVPDGSRRAVRTELQKENDRLVASVSSRAEADWQQHAVGEVHRMAREPSPTRDLEQIRARCHDEVHHNQFSSVEGDAFRFGPRWQGLRSVHLGRDEGLASIELPIQFDDPEFVLHPALLDLATSFLAAYLVKGAYLPVFYRRLRIYGTLPYKLFAHARASGPVTTDADTLTLDIDVLDPEGKLLVEVEGFTLKRIGDLLGKFDTKKPSPASASVRFGAGIPPADGVQAFARILATAPGSQIAVCDTDLPAVLEIARSGAAGESAAMAEETERPAHARPTLASSYVEPRTPVERTLADLWQQVLGLAQVGVDDNFFELGGDSVSALRVITNAKKAGLQLTPQHLFECPTIGQLAASLASPAEATETPQPAKPDLVPLVALKEHDLEAIAAQIR